MRFSMTTESLLKPLQAVHGVVERRQTLPILSNVLVVAKEGVLSLTGTDMEVELIARTHVDDMEDGEITVPARKFVDICRALPSEGEVKFNVDGEVLQGRPIAISVMAGLARLISVRSLRR